MCFGFYGAVDGTLKSWLTQEWNCLVSRVGAWLQTVGEKQDSGKAQQSSEEPSPHPTQRQGGG